MSCTHPMYALKLGVNPETGKQKIKILPKRFDQYSYQYLSERFGKDYLLELPCGHCDSCIESRARSWAARCSLEASLYDKNSFVTLTYNNNSYPKGGLCKKDVQKFIKRLRVSTSDEISYFCCGEYGPESHRGHYHIIIFNWFPDDAVLVQRGKHGGFIYESKTLNKLWPFGYSNIGEVSYASCGYVARYCQKKLYKTITDFVDKDGVVHHPNPEFSLMSKDIGKRYFMENFELIYSTDKVYHKFSDNMLYSAPFRYFDKLMEKVDPIKLESVKRERISKANTSFADELLKHSMKVHEDLLLYKESVKTAKFDKLTRRNV